MHRVQCESVKHSVSEQMNQWKVKINLIAMKAIIHARIDSIYKKIVFVFGFFFYEIGQFPI